MLSLASGIKKDTSVFQADYLSAKNDIAESLDGAGILVIGGAGSIGQNVVKELLRFKPRRLHVVDISENNLAELVRDIRSSQDCRNIELSFLAIDVGSQEFQAYLNHQTSFEFLFNLSALKHVRSEKDPFTLMRLLQTNVINTRIMMNAALEKNCRRFFSVSTDKASAPINMMGASKRFMEYLMYSRSQSLPSSSARFANVAFSDGSLLHSFENRFKKKQAIVAPNDVQRYFIDGVEAAQLCLLSTLTAENTEILFPKQSSFKEAYSFSQLAETFLAEKGFTPDICTSEEEAREKANALGTTSNYWPVLFTESNTSGEKAIEIFYSAQENIDSDRYQSIGVIKSYPNFAIENVESSLDAIERYRQAGVWDKDSLVDLVFKAVPEFNHHDCGYYLDEKM